MFSPSLLAMIFHSLGTGLRIPTTQRVTAASTGVVASYLKQLLTEFRKLRKPMPSIPVSGHTNSSELINILDGYVEHRVGLLLPNEDRSLNLWGRFPVDKLVLWLEENFDVDAEYEYLDLGTPLAAAQRTRANVARCEKLILPHRPRRPVVQVAVIDRGEFAQGLTPNNMGGRIHHLNDTNVVFADHAADVFETLLERLDHYNAIPMVELIFGLVCAPARHIGLECFQHANTVELQSTLHKLQKYLENSELPVVTNLSMGTHVGPHQGNSPIEEHLRQAYCADSLRHFVCSAGNDGVAGIADSRTVDPNIPEYFRLRTNASGCGELLVEFWWESTSVDDFNLCVDVSDQAGRTRGSRMTVGPNQAGVTDVLSTTGVGFNTADCKSLYHSRCLGDLHCIAFAMSAGNHLDLANLIIDITVKGNQTTIQLDAWVVIADNQCCSFVGGGVDKSLRVPATMPEAVSVAGLNDDGQPWRHSSRGSLGSNGSPALAYWVKCTSSADEGTSFSAPRATADIINLMCLSPLQGIPANTLSGHAKVLSVVLPILNICGTRPNGLWNPRVGYGKVVGKP